jgi:hypothetical protein
MAGIMALVNQKFGAQGQANFVLYPLAAQQSSVFHDITMGSNNVPCQQGSPSCTLSTLKDNTTGFFTLGQFYAAPGYDQATGLGSFDANLLIKYWNSLTFTSTTTTLNLSQTSFTHGAPINVSVAVTGTGGTPSGDIALVTTAGPSTNKGLGELTLQSGTASATLNDFPGGQYQVTARYAGDAVFAPSSSSAVTVNVAPENSTVSLSGKSFDTTNNTLVPVSNGASYAYGTFIALDAQPQGISAPPGSQDGVPTGMITFTDAASPGTVSSGSLNLDSKGLAEWIPAAGFPVGSHSVSAAYSGDASFNASSSTTPITFTITKSVPQAISSADPKTIGAGYSTTLTTIVGIFGYAGQPTGTVTFSFGSTILGTAPLNFTSQIGFPGASLSVNSLPIGTDVVTATYNGDANFNPVSSTITVTVTQPSNLSAVANPPAINEAQSAVITATVPGVSGQPTPTGFIGIYATGPGASYSSAGAPLVNGSATQTLDGSFFNAGNISVQVTYYGDSIYAPATVTLSVTDAFPFTLGATTPVITAPGATTGDTSTVTITPFNGFTGAVYLSCALASSPQGAVHLPTCTTPQSVNIPGTAAVTAVMTINSTAPSSSGLFYPAPRPPMPNIPLPNEPGWLVEAVLAILLLLGICGQRRHRLRLAGSLFLLAALGGLAACGGGGSNGGPVPVPGTTPGNYTFTVTGSFTATIGASQPQTATVTVTIQ